MAVIYREYQPNDFDMLSEIIKITWNHGKYYSYGVSCRVADAYLRFCLSEQTFAQVAEVNEKTVGIIIGNNFLKCHFLLIIFYMQCMILYVFQCRKKAQCMEIF